MAITTGNRRPADPNRPGRDRFHVIVELAGDRPARDPRHPFPA